MKKADLLKKAEVIGCPIKNKKATNDVLAGEISDFIKANPQAQQVYDDWKADNQPPAADAKKKVKVKITGGVAYLGLPHNIGQVATVTKKQAKELIKAGRAEKV